MRVFIQHSNQLILIEQKSWVQIELPGITGCSSRNTWPWDTTSTSILQRTFGMSLGLNFNLKLLSIFLLCGDLNLHLEFLEIFCFAGISTSISKHLNCLQYKFWNHWVFLLLLKKSDISTLMLFLYGYVCPVIYMALNAKMFLWWFYAPNFQWSSRRTRNFQP